MMRAVVVTTGLFLLAGCGSPKPATDEYAANFVPPTLIKRAEYETLLEARWTRLDRNLDGAIVASEIPVKFADRLNALDADHDGKITHSEFIHGSMTRFDREDTNHDGLLTNVESSAARKTEEATDTENKAAPL